MSGVPDDFRTSDAAMLPEQLSVDRGGLRVALDAPALHASQDLGVKMRALVIYETLFGNTRRVAKAVADGMRDGAKVDLIEVVDAPETVPADVDLLVLGGPTHVFSMSRPSTRREAARRGGAFTDVPTGIREWLDALPRSENKQTFVAFDTRVEVAERRADAIAARPPSFAP